MPKHPLGSVAPGVTFALSSRSNAKAMLMSLSSVLLAPLVPEIVQLRLEGEFPGIAEFYLEQLVELARQRDVRMPIEAFVSQGVRKARQWHLDECRTKLLWMGDDDCIYQPRCLRKLLQAHTAREQLSEADLGFIVGCKIDLNNRRGYLNFDTQLHPDEDLIDGCSFNHLYDAKDGRYPRVKTLDTGNVLLRVDPLRKTHIRFDPFDVSANAGGEDTAFALQCDKQKLWGFFAPQAIALHLEKIGQSFGEFAARKELLLRSADLMGWDRQIIQNEFMPGV